MTGSAQRPKYPWTSVGSRFFSTGSSSWDIHLIHLLLLCPCPRPLIPAADRESISLLSAGWGPDVLDCWAVRLSPGAPVPIDPAEGRLSIRSLLHTPWRPSRVAKPDQRIPGRIAVHASAPVSFTCTHHIIPIAYPNTTRPSQGYFLSFFFRDFFGLHHSRSTSARGRVRIISHPSSHRIQPSRPTIPGSSVSKDQAPSCWLSFVICLPPLL
ncbi:hypothetical protein TgHK011_004451 [Trichoderma gracile]|nr:hypothetical protein TgHK011_004451 [Trichoderma gracile]